MTGVRALSVLCGMQGHWTLWGFRWIPFPWGDGGRLELRNALLTGVSQWQTDLKFTPEDQVLEDQELKQWQPLDLSSLWNYSDLILSSQCS